MPISIGEFPGKIILLDGRTPAGDRQGMTTTLSSKGQVVLPQKVRSRLRLLPGAKFDCKIQGDAIVLTPQAPRKARTRHVIDEVSGLRVTKGTKTGARVTSDMVRAMLADFP
jgi:AbrB family looped-hinge helix DNA binding protein